MKKRKLFTQIFASFLIIMLLGIIAFGISDYHAWRDFYTNTIISDLKAPAKLTSLIIKDKSLLNNVNKIRKTCYEISDSAGMRITIILPNGKVLSDSHENPEEMENHRTRPEIIKALNGVAAHSIRYSATLRKNLIYVAVPFYQNGKLAAVIRTATSLSEFDAVLLGVKSRLIWIGFFVLLMTALVSYIIAKRVSAPLEEISRETKNFRKGKFSKLNIPESSEEIADLAESYNRMTKELKKRLKTISRERNEQEAIFLSMKEGVLAIDSSERILKINNATIKFFQINSTASEITKLHTYEVIRNTEMLNFIRKSLNKKVHLEEEITVFGEKERVLLVNADPLLTKKNKLIGTIVVMNDITRVKEWDKIRQDFAANVSHELKTPITSIKGYVETLLSSDVKDKETVSKFLDIINRQTNQLNALIDDLLQLSKLDSDASIETRKELIIDVINLAVQYCAEEAVNKNIQINIECAEDLEANINAALFVRALINLIDNAVKYSSENNRILITAEKRENEIYITCKDWGMGIPKEHHSRLFERFYRVDRGRSREMGGTGLGLSIVKHIVLTHKGKISVESTPGKGSTFKIILPS